MLLMLNCPIAAPAVLYKHYCKAVLYFEVILIYHANWPNSKGEDDSFMSCQIGCLEYIWAAS